jgi:hypothetical protein
VSDDAWLGIQYAAWCWSCGLLWHGVSRTAKRNSVVSETVCLNAPQPKIGALPTSYKSLVTSSH